MGRPEAFAGRSPCYRACPRVRGRCPGGCVARALRGMGDGDDADAGAAAGARHRGQRRGSVARGAVSLLRQPDLRARRGRGPALSRHDSLSAHDHRQRCCPALLQRSRGTHPRRPVPAPSLHAPPRGRRAELLVPRAVSHVPPGAGATSAARRGHRNSALRGCSTRAVSSRRRFSSSASRRSGTALSG